MLPLFVFLVAPISAVTVYLPTKSGTCVSNGGEIITDNSECVSAANSIIAAGLADGITDNTITYGGGSGCEDGDPGGCYWKDFYGWGLYKNTNEGHWGNDNPSAPCSGCSNAKRCLCKFNIPTCANTVGQNSNPTVPCACGGTGQICESTTSYCSVFLDQCASSPGAFTAGTGAETFIGSPCTSTNGGIPNTEPCVCTPSAGCDSGSGLVCDRSASTPCSHASTCLHIDGMTENSGTCKCGTVDCYGDVRQTVSFIANVGDYSCGSNCGNKELVIKDYDDIVCPSTVDKTNWLSGDTNDDTFSITVGPRGCVPCPGFKITTIRSGGTSSWGMDLKFSCTGKVARSSDRGLFCKVSNNQCTLTKQLFTMVTDDSASCEAVANRVGLSTVDQCKEASDVEPEVDVDNIGPPDGAGGISCSASCVAGSNSRTFFSAAGSLDRSYNSCNSNPCKGCWCFQGDSCTHTAGLTENSGACICGSSACTESTGYHCIAATSTCAKTAAKANFFLRRYGNCKDVTNSYDIPTQAMCKEGSDAIGLKSWSDGTPLVVDDVSNEGNNQMNHGCSVWSEFSKNLGPKLYYNSDLIPGTCGRFDTCLCVYAPPCTQSMHDSGSKCTCEHKLGGIFNGGDCFCGTTICSGSNLYCKESSSYCTNIPTACRRPNSMPGYEITNDPKDMSTTNWNSASFLGKCLVLNGYYGSGSLGVDTPPTPAVCSGSSNEYKVSGCTPVPAETPFIVQLKEISNPSQCTVASDNETYTNKLMLNGCTTIMEGIKLNIKGGNFGNTPNKVMINHIVCPHSSWTSSEIICTPAPESRAGSNLDVNVYHANGKSSANIPLKGTLTYNAPTISNIYPTVGTTEGGVLTTFTGTNFGSLSSKASLTMVLPDGASTPSPWTSLTLISDTEMTAYSPALTKNHNGHNAKVQLIVSNQLTYSMYHYIGPSIDSISPTVPVSRVQKITVLGTEFANVEDGRIEIYSQPIGSTSPQLECSHVRRDSATTLTCNYPESPLQFEGEAQLELKVKVAGQISSSSVPIYFCAKPRLIAVSKNGNASVAGGEVVAITGQYFDKCLTGDSMSISASIGNLPMTNVTYIDPGTILATTPRFTLTSASKNLDVTVVVQGQKTTATAMYSYAKPTIAGLLRLAQRKTSPTATGIPMIINGSNFADVDDVKIEVVRLSPETRKGEIEGTCEVIEHLSNNLLKCQYPQEGFGCSYDVSVRVTIAGQASTEIVPLCYDGENIAEKDKLPRPTDVTLGKYSGNNNISVKISWEYTKPTSASSFILDTADLFTVQLSYDPDFSQDDSKILSTFSTQNKNELFAVIPNVVTIPLWKTVVYARVRTTRAATTTFDSLWSTGSKEWQTVDKCTESEFLETRNVTNDPSLWYCRQCPNGASCLAKRTWDGVKPLFGYARCVENGSLFEQCTYAGACLGGFNPAMKGKSIGVNGTDMADQDWDEGCLLPMYKNGSRLCSACGPNYSHKGLSGECHQCPEPEVNTLIAVLGIFGGLIGMIVFIFITITDDGTFDASDGVKTIGLSYIQLVSMLVTFPIAWPDVFVSVFEVGGAVSVSMEHLVNVKCMYPLQTEADVFYSMSIATALLPVFLSLASALCWVLILRCPLCVLLKKKRMKNKKGDEKGKKNGNDQDKKEEVDPLVPRIRATITALLFLIWPNLCTSTFSIFSCRSICNGEGSFLRADFEEECFVSGGRHETMVLAIGIPSLIVYVIGLPISAGVGVWLTHKRAKQRNVSVATLKGHRTWAPFYIAYRPDKWWWELTVVARKIVISCIGVFGGTLGMMQVHLALLLVVLVGGATTMMSPFGGKYAWLLLNLEVLTLGSTFGVLWAGSVFSTYPQCLDPNGNGSTLWWCDTLSILIGIFVFICMLILIGAFVYISAKEAKEAKKSSLDSAGAMDYINPMERSLEMIERKQKQKEKTKKQIKRIRKAHLSLDRKRKSQTNNGKKGTNNPVKDEVKDQLEVEVKEGANNQVEDEVKDQLEVEVKEEEAAIEILVDEESGKRYSWNSVTGESIWQD